MIYEHLIRKYAKKDVAYCGVIGAGYYNSSLVTQELATSRLHICAVCNSHAESARSAFELAGIPNELLEYCDSVEAASKAISKGKYVFTEKPEIILECPEIDVIAEGTGNSEAASMYCLEAIKNGKHIVMATKGMDSAIGPIIKRKAAEKGLVYTQVDGDQPALLIEMVEWARTAGLEVISAGKSIDFEYNTDFNCNKVYLLADEVLNKQDVAVDVSPEDMKYFGRIPVGEAEHYLAKRRELLAGLPGVGSYDLCELTIVANATGLKPVSPQCTQAVLRTTEIPEVYNTKDNGGILDEAGVIDLLITARNPEESGLGGGVYIVVKASNPHSQHIIATKGQITNHNSSAVVLYRPWHLCGVETNISAISAALLGVATGALDYQQQYDMIRVAARDIAKGETIKGDRDPSMKSLIVKATKMGPDSAVPGHLLVGNIAAKDIPAGKVITYSDVIRPENSTLWSLREQQEMLYS